MLQGKEVAKYFKNLPNFNIREDSEEPLSKRNEVCPVSV